ncbi:unnamed protein product [Parajaminaea phylloscopi]
MASLLLRLFHSDYFSPHLALSYLKTYSDNIGITYYLVYRLRTSFEPEEVEFYWPQLCHLLITKPSESRALECFILERCEESVHVALLTLWYLQAALFDLGSDPHTASFGVCKRVYNECQRILYDDPLSDANVSLVSTAPGPSSSSSSSGSRLRRFISSSSRARERISPRNTKSAYVGMGTVMASTFGMPSLAAFSGQVAVEQGRAKPNTTSPKTAEGLATGIERVNKSDGSEEEDVSHDLDASDSEGDDEDGGPSGRSTGGPSSHQSGAPSTAPAAAQPSKPPPKSATLPVNGASAASQGKGGSSSENPFSTLSAGFTGLRGKATAVGEAFGQTFGVTFIPGETTKPRPRPAWHARNSGRRRHEAPPHQSAARRVISESAKSVPNLNGSRTSLSGFASTAALGDTASQSGSVDAVLQQYDSEARRRLLRSNYCRTQTQFLLTLQDVSARLLLLPKPARLSALRAELTALNHKLPAEVCFPMWCAARSEEGAGEDSRDALDESHSVPGFGVGDASVEPGRHAKRGPRTHSLKHHRVVRINPSEAVVLNSADRAPYLLHVEVLQDDLDFDPERRSNRESLKRLVVAEDLRRRKFALSRAFGTDSEQSSKEALALARRDSSKGIVTAPDQVATNADEEVPVEPTLGPRFPERSRFDRTVSSSSAAPSLLAGNPQRSKSPSRPASPSPPENDEEVDLTEQAFGADLSAFGGDPDPASEEEDDYTAMNRHHDAAAWTSAQQKHASTSEDAATSHARRESLSVLASQRRDFSLDEYSERMRTAAVMLAQLNQSTNAASQPAVTHNPHVSSTAQGGWSSWIMGTSWAANSSTTRSEAGQGSAGIRAAVPIPKAPISGQDGETGTAAASSGGVKAAASTASGSAAFVTPSVGGGGSTSSRLIHTDTEMIRKRIMQEMMALEEERMERMKSGSRKLGPSGRRPTATVEDEATVLRAVNKDDPSAAMFRETWAAKKARIRASSPYGHLPSWDVFSVIVKTGADLRQEQLAVQLINEFGRIWQECSSKIWVRYFRILVTSENSGLMETVTDAVSVHSIKKEAYARAQKVNGAEGGKITTYSIYDHFVDTYGDPSSAKFNRARDRFMESLAGYSIISYLLQIKDRHNGNILLGSDGRLIHIDFGFMLGISPGGVGFEAAPFKLTQEYIDILGGLDSPKFEEFKKLMRQGFKDARKEAERIIMIVELMQRQSKLPCFALGELTASNLRDRFALALSAQQVDDFVDRLILASCASSYTRLYDTFQYYSQGIL